MGGAQFARACVGGARDCKRMEALTLVLFLFACTLSPSRGAVANLVLLPDAVKEVSFVWALRCQAVEGRIDHFPLISLVGSRLPGWYCAWLLLQGR